MEQNTISQYFLLNSNIGHAKIVEFDSVDGIIYIWGIAKKYSYCNTCSYNKDFIRCTQKDDCPLLKIHKDEIQDPTYHLIGDFENTKGYFNSFQEFFDVYIKKTYPNSKAIPLGSFNSVYECRKYLEYIKATLNGLVV